MSEDASIPLLNHELAADELAWMQAVYADFSSTRAAFSDPKEALRAVLGRDEHRLPTPMDLSGPGPWRNGRNRHDRMVTAVFLPKVELRPEEEVRVPARQQRRRVPTRARLRSILRPCESDSATQKAS